jgi:hypothetical protein
MIDQDACVYPMVGPGMGYKEMVTGEYIASRTPGGSGTEDVDMSKIRPVLARHVSFRSSDAGFGVPSSSPGRALAPREPKLQVTGWSVRNRK